MKIKIFINVLSIFWISLVAHAQNFQKIEGKIFDNQTKEPIVGANIYIPNSKTGTVTNSEGFFSLQIPENTPKISVEAIGYEIQEISIKSTSLNIALKANIQELQNVVVTANREASVRTETPIAITKISSQMIQEAKPTAIYEVLNKATGVLMVNLNNEQHSMAIRQPIGTSPYYLYMEDGIPIRSMGVFNHNALLETNQFAVSSIEVVKGPVSSIYGPEAVGGTVNFITQRPTAIPTVRAGIQIDQWGYHRLQMGAGAKIGKLGIYVGGLKSQQIDSWITNSNYDKNIINTRLEYHFNEKTRLIGTFMYGKYYSQMSGSTDSLAFYNREYISTSDFTYRQSEASRSRLTLERDWNQNSKTFITIFNRVNTLGQNPSYAIRWRQGQTTATGEINSNYFESYGVVAQHSERFKFLDSKLILGGLHDFSPNRYSAYRIDLEAKLRPDGRSVEKYTILQERSDIRLADYNAKINNSATYLQYDFAPIKNLRISLGSRWDRMAFTYTNDLDKTDGKKEYSQITSKIGATYDFGKDKGVYTNVSQGFAPPSLTAVFRRKPNPDPNAPAEFYYNLKPAQFINYEIGGWMALFENKLYADLAIYQMNGKNELLNIRQPDNSFDYQSAGKTLHRGIEMGFTYKPTSEFFLRWGATIATHKFEDFQISNKETDLIRNLDGFQMPNAPRWVWNTEFTYYPKWLKGFRSALEWQHVSGYYQNQINTVRYDAYDLLNLRIGYEWNGLEVFSNVMNIANTLYATNVSRGNNPTDRSTFTPSAPRTFVMGIQYNFSANK